MKKKILCFIFAFIFMLPFTFMLSGCFGEQPPSDPPPTEQGGNGDQDGDNGEQPKPITVQEVLNGFSEAQDIKNYTAKINVEYSEKLYDVQNNLTGAGTTNGVTLPTLTLAVNNLHYYMNIPSYIEIYNINGETFNKNLSDDEDSYSYSNFSDSSQQVFDNVVKSVNNILDKDLITTLVSISETLNAGSVYVVEESEKVTLKINLDLATFLNNTLTNISTNNSKELKYLFDTMHKDFTGTQGDILEFIEEFEQQFTNTTTVKDFFDFICQKTGFDIDYIVNYFYNFYYIYQRINTPVQEWNYIDELISEYNAINSDLTGRLYCYNLTPNPEILSLQELGWDDIKNTLLVDTVDTTDTDKTAKELFFESLNDLFNNPEVTLNSFLQSSLTEEEYNDYLSIVDAFEGTNVKNSILNLGLVFDKNYNLEVINIAGDFEYTLVDTQTEDGEGAKYLFDTSITLTDVGETIIPVPTDIALKSATINYTIKASDIEKISANYVKSLGYLSVDIPSFSFVGYEYDEETLTHSTTPITFVTYNSATKLISINSTYLLQALALQDCNFVEYKIYNDDFTLYIQFTVVA